jgi:hypothetical protein
MREMFYGARSFTGSSGDLAEWNTQSLIDMSSAFYGAPYRGSLPWNTGQVTNMAYAFYQSDFNGDGVDVWDVSNVSDFSYTCTFLWDESRGILSISFVSRSHTIPTHPTVFEAVLFEGNVTSWDTSSATIMHAMVRSSTDNDFSDVSLYISLKMLTLLSMLVFSARTRFPY